jgi:hypothetical protein
MKLKFIQATVACFMLPVCSLASAGIISKYSAGQLYERTCPTATSELECISESRTNSNFIKTKGQLNYDGIDVHVENNDNSSWIDMLLDDENYNLPEAHMVITSAKGERKSGNMFSAQEFLWTGGDDTLTFSADFDFTVSGGFWNNAIDSYYVADISVWSDLIVPTDITGPSSIYPTNQNNEDDYISWASYFSFDDVDVVAEELQVKTLSTSFNVKTGDSFYLSSTVRGFAMNGGWVDSANTLTSSLTAANTNDLSQSLVVVNKSINVPEPSTLAIFTLGLMGLVFRRSKKQ